MKEHPNLYKTMPRLSFMQIRNLEVTENNGIEAG
jgi:hypothetical protein